MASSGWGLAPGSLEKNVTRSLGGRYGAIGNNQNTISGMLQQKYAAGLKAKSAREGFDLSKTIEANRKAEATRAYGLASQKFDFSKTASDRQFELDTEKFGFTKTQADKAWEEAQRRYELDKMRVTSGLEQQELDRDLERTRMNIQSSYNDSEQERHAEEFAVTMAASQGERLPWWFQLKRNVGLNGPPAETT
jgi:hypothetical protein